jgi:hypothetical protein
LVWAKAVADRARVDSSRVAFSFIFVLRETLDGNQLAGLLSSSRATPV